MEIIVLSRSQACQYAVDKIAQVLTQTNGKATLGLATGGTMTPLYAKLCQSNLDFSHATSFNLDEYVGLAPDNPQSYHYYMNDQLFFKKPFWKSYLPQGNTADAAVAAKAYHEKLVTTPRDLQLLGIGENGHIGFNEPGSSPTSITRVLPLTESTRRANSRYFDDEKAVPTHAISMGLSEILAAKQIILIAFGQKKAKAIYQMTQRPPHPDCPASFLQNHPNTVVLCDTAAASLLK